MSDLIDRQAALKKIGQINGILLFNGAILINYLDAEKAIEDLPSAQPEQRWIPCGKCIHADGKHRWCKVLDRTINEDYFCCWAEPWKEGVTE